jgi:hypothetical protein
MFKLLQTKDLGEARIDIAFDGKPTGAWIKIAGPEHQRSREATAEFDRQRRVYRKKYPGRELVDDNVESRKATIDLMLARTLDWGGFADDDGRPLEFNEQNVREAYELRWLRSQVLTAMGDEENFTPRSASSSSTSPASISG